MNCRSSDVQPFAGAKVASGFGDRSRWHGVCSSPVALDLGTLDAEKDMDDLGSATTSAARITPQQLQACAAVLESLRRRLDAGLATLKSAQAPADRDVPQRPDATDRLIRAGRAPHTP